MNNEQASPTTATIAPTIPPMSAPSRCDVGDVAVVAVVANVGFGVAAAGVELALVEVFGPGVANVAITRHQT